MSVSIAPPEINVEQMGWWLLANSIVLVDGKNFVFRHHFAHVDLKTKNGKPTSVLYGCLSGLLSLATKLPPDTPIVFVWEDGNGDTWRHRIMRIDKSSQPTEPVVKTTWSQAKILGGLNRIMNPAANPTTNAPKAPVGYKANRKLENQQGERKAVANAQLSELRRILDLIGIRQFYIRSLECDDLMGILAETLVQKNFFDKVIIHSTDRDFYQLLCPRIRILSGIRDGRTQWVSEDEVEILFGVKPENWTRYRAITGDHSDNIPGVLRGVGPKTAVQWVHAGVDASIENYDDLSLEVKRGISQLKAPKSGIVDWPTIWSRLHRNYICSHILRDADFPLLEPAVRTEIKFLLATLERNDFLRHLNGRSEAAYREFTEWLAEHEMADLLARRESFWKLV